MQSRLTLDIDWPSLLWAALGGASRRRQEEAATSALEQYFSLGHIVVGLSVRTIFDALLTELALPPNSPVLMSGVNIKNMGDIVAAHGLRTAAVDIDANSLAPKSGDLAAAQSLTKAELCVVTQLFGAVNVYPDAAQLRDRGVFLVEDAAQGFAGAFHTGSADADLSLFSFGPIKRRTALGGAIAVFRDGRLAERVRRRLDAYAPLSEMWYRRRAIKYALLKAASHPIAYGLVVKAIATLGKDSDAVIGGAARGFDQADIVRAIRRKPPKRMITLLARQVMAAPDAKTRSAVCRDFLRHIPEAAKVGETAQANAYWLMPIRTKNPTRFITRLRKAGFDATQGATSLRALAPEQTPLARELMAHIVYVPNPADLSEKRRQELTGAVLGALNEGG